ncbi:hypothetical protein BKA22_003862 [Cellulomonas soli]|nr:hypothetical protein [Cellulomonas soli]
MELTDGQRELLASTDPAALAGGRVRAGRVMHRSGG